ncbi:hypothetical protein T439DRAFT_327504 [Meredithblackwellia eburnea MCA 4105]
MAKRKASVLTQNNTKRTRQTAGLEPLVKWEEKATTIEEQDEVASRSDDTPAPYQLPDKALDIVEEILEEKPEHGEHEKASKALPRVNEDRWFMPNERGREGPRKEEKPAKEELTVIPTSEKDEEEDDSENNPKGELGEENAELLRTFTLGDDEEGVHGYAEYDGDLEEEDWSLFREKEYSALQSLTLYDTIKLIDPEDTSPLKIPLESLTIHNKYADFDGVSLYSHCHPDAFLEALFKGTRNTLRRIDATYVSDCFDLPFHLLSPDFDHLSLHIANFLTSPISLSKISGIKTLQLSTKRILDEDSCDDYLVSVFESLPPGMLQHLNVDVQSSEMSDGTMVFDAVASTNSLSNLTKLTLSGGDPPDKSGWEEESMASHLALMSRRGIEFWWDGDMILGPGGAVPS